MRRYGMKGLRGGPDHHAKAGEANLRFIENTFDEMGSSAPTLEDAFALTAALAKASAHLIELPPGQQKSDLTERFKVLRDAVEDAKTSVAQGCRLSSRRRRPL